MTAGRIVNAEKKDWNTPPKYTIPITEFFGRIDLDPCSNTTSLIQANTRFIYPSKDGLVDEWKASTVFVNPPYGRSNGTSLYDWLLKSVNEYEKYNFEVIFLIPVATNTRHFKEIVFKEYDAICFLSDTRLKFYNNGVEDKKGAPMACCLCYKGHRRLEFKNKFDEYGMVFLID